MSNYEAIRAHLAQKGHEGAELDREAQTTEAKIVAVRIGVDVMRAHICELEAQRDELARCLRDVVDGFARGDFAYGPTDASAVFKTAVLLTHCQAALIRSGKEAT